MEFEFIKKLNKLKKRPIRLYHGTSDKFLDSIMKDGLRPGANIREVAKQLAKADAELTAKILGTGFDNLKEYQEPECVYVTEGYGAALIFADDRVDVDGGEPIVLELELNLSDVDSFRPLFGLEAEEPGFEMDADDMTRVNALCIQEGIVDPLTVDDEIDLLIQCFNSINTPEQPFLEPIDIRGHRVMFQGSEWLVCDTIPPTSIKKVRREGFFTRKFGKK